MIADSLNSQPYHDRKIIWHCVIRLNGDFMATAALAELDKQFGIPGSVKVCTGNGALPRILVSNSQVQGEIYLYGAQVTSWKPAGYEELIFVSSKSSWQEDFELTKIDRKSTRLN